MVTTSKNKARAWTWIGRLAGLLIGALVLIVLAVVIVIYRQGTRPITGSAQYVALGSSFASGPGIFPRAVNSPLLCARSSINYAHQLAHKRGLALIDMSCAGATTHDVLVGGQYSQPAQLAALSASTQWVTVTIGGNDVAYLGNLIALSCRRGHSFVSTMLRACKVTPEAVVNQHFSELRGNLLAIANAVRNRSPDAKLVFVDYLDVLPATGNCPALNLSDADVASMRVIAQRLKDATRAVALASGATLVDPNRAGVDHSVCSSDPWINPRFPPQLLTAPFHPNSAGMTAVAAAVDDAL